MNVLSTLLTVLMILMLTAKNPVKASLIILIAALLLFTTMSWTTSSIWIPMISTLLFTGGVLVLFMILSSFHPNETSKKMKIKLILLGSLLITTNASKGEPSMSMPAAEAVLKSLCQNYSTSVIMTIAISLYFMTFMKILKKEKTSMRLILC